MEREDRKGKERTQTQLNILRCRPLGHHVHRRFQNRPQLHRLRRQLEVVELDLTVVEDIVLQARRNKNGERAKWQKKDAR